MTTNAIDKEHRLVDLQGVMAWTSRSKAALYNDIRLKRFPAPLKMGRSARWLYPEIAAWIDEQAAKRDKGAQVLHDR